MAEIVEGEVSEAKLIDQFAPQQIPIDRLVKIYLRIRGAIADVQKKYDAELEELESTKKTVSHALKEQIKAAGGTSIKTEYGTAMLRQTTRYWTSDWESFEKFCMEQKSICFLEKRVAQKNMAEFLAAHPEQTPQGLNAESEIVVTVKKPT